MLGEVSRGAGKKAPENSERDTGRIGRPVLQSMGYPPDTTHSAPALAQNRRWPTFGPNPTRIAASHDQRSDPVNLERRTLCAGTLAVLAMPRLGVAQLAPRMRRIGFLSLSKADAEVSQLGVKLTLESLRRLGWEYGKNLLIERR